MAVYVAHLDSPYPRDSRASIRHYAGFVNVYSRGGISRIERRHWYHANGRGSRLLAAVSSRGIGWRVTRIIWDGTRDDERRMKRSRNLARHCPVCNPRLRRQMTRSPRWSIAPVVGVFVPRLTDDESSSTVVESVTYVDSV